MTEPFYHDNWETIYCGDSLKILPELHDIDGVITDPPYELSFMGKDWDNTGISFRPETWKAVKDTCKPGAMMLCFGGTRTWHRIAVAIEDAGWEIRDTLMWLHGMGYPKSHNISKAIDKTMGAEREVIGKQPYTSQNIKGNAYESERAKQRERIEVTITNPATPEAQLWDGYGTGLKPCWEPILLCMKPIEGTFVENALKYGVAGLNIGGSRIGIEKIVIHGQGEDNFFHGGFSGKIDNRNRIGRWPGNLILDEEVAQELDEQSGIVKGGGGISDHMKNVQTNKDFASKRVYGFGGFNDFGGVSRYFYTAKASKAERDAWIEDMPETTKVWNGKSDKSCEDMNTLQERWTTKLRNDHATVKPISLLKYLCNLIKPPVGGVLIDPFMGSGSTLVACQDLGIQSIGIDLSKHNCEIAVKRLIHKPLL